MVTNFILVFKTKLIKSYFYFIQHIKFGNRISILLEIIRVTNYISTFIHLITLQTFSLRHTDVEHQKSRIIYPTSSQSAHIVGNNVSWELKCILLLILIFKTVKRFWQVQTCKLNFIQIDSFSDFSAILKIVH